jgi:hypothetical protein
METMYLGEDGTLYQVQGLSEERAFEGLGQCFLGEDGLLYQVQGCDTDGRLSVVSGRIKTWERMTFVRVAKSASGPTVRCVIVAEKP